MTNIDIFCDGSVNTVNETEAIPERLGCAGSLILFDGEPVYYSNKFIRGHWATNNATEILAIENGIRTFLSLFANMSVHRAIVEGYTKLNLYSDSRICIEGLRDWIFGWHRYRDQNCILYNSSKMEVSNQDTFLRIVKLVLDYQLPINFLHQKGHVTNSISSLKEAQKTFLTSNSINLTIDQVRFISRANSFVDKQTKFDLIGMMKELGMNVPIGIFAGVKPEEGYESIDIYNNGLQYPTVCSPVFNEKQLAEYSNLIKNGEDN